MVFESGISASSINWITVQPQVARFTSCVSYDRAGLGWSDPPREAFDVDRMVADLAALLDQLKLPAPYVLVGHSYGGLLVRLFGERYPGKVAGLVLIDPVLACHWAHPDADRARLVQRGVSVSRLGVWLARFGLIRLATSRAVVDSVVVPKFGENGLVDRLKTDLVKLPHETIPTVRAHWRRPQNFRAAIAHLTALEKSFTALKNLPLECPITVISAGNTEPEGLAEHRAIAALSPRGQHIVAQQSGHWVQVEEPQLVIDAIRRVVLWDGH